MKNNFLSQLWVALRIWLVALFANSIIGSLYLVGNFDLVYIGTIMGCAYSFPIFLAILIIINRCLATKQSGLFVFRFALISGLVLTGCSWVAFIRFEDFVIEPFALLFIALLAATIGVASQYGSLFRLAFGAKKFDDYLDEIRDEPKPLKEVTTTKPD